MSSAGPSNRQNTVKFLGLSGPERSKARSEKGYKILWARLSITNIEKMWLIGSIYI